MIAGILFGFVPLAIWLYLLLFHSGFWAAARNAIRSRSPRPGPLGPAVVVAVWSRPATRRT